MAKASKVLLGSRLRRSASASALPKIHNSAHSSAHVQPLAMTTVETLTAGITSGKTTEDRAPHAAEMGKLVASDPTAMKELWCAPSR